MLLLKYNKLKINKMNLIPWEDKYSIGIVEIDDQHKKMLSIINRLHNLLEEKKNDSPNEIEAIIQEMVDYAIYHFQTEEKYFKLFSYEKSEEHIGIHNQYKAKIEDWHKRYSETKDGAIFFEISTYLHDWWTWHINNSDRDYAPLLIENGVK